MKPTKNRYFCVDARRTKMLFETEAAAKRFIKFNSEEMKAEGRKAPKRAYFCAACNGWHVTSHNVGPNYKSRVEQYFENRKLVEEILPNDKCNYVKTEPKIVKRVKELKHDIDESVYLYLNASNELETTYARNLFNLTRDELLKLQEDRACGGFKLTHSYIPVVELLVDLFNGNKNNLGDVFGDIYENRSHKNFCDVRHIVKYVSERMELEKKINNALN